MSTTEVLVMLVFGALVVGGVALSLVQARRSHDEAVRYAEARGADFLDAADAALEEWLKTRIPDERWTVHAVTRLQPPPESLYLFGYENCMVERPKQKLHGYAALARHRGRTQEPPVIISTRTPVVDPLSADDRRFGSEEFRRAFTVICDPPEAASPVLTGELQRILLGHRAGAGWYLTVTIAGDGVLVASSWARPKEEWDHLTELATSLRDAVR